MLISHLTAASAVQQPVMRTITLLFSVILLALGQNATDVPAITSPIPTTVPTPAPTPSPTTAPPTPPPTPPPTTVTPTPTTVTPPPTATATPTPMTTPPTTAPPTPPPTTTAPPTATAAPTTTTAPTTTLAPTTTVVPTTTIAPTTKKPTSSPVTTSAPTTQAAPVTDAPTDEPETPETPAPTTSKAPAILSTPSPSAKSSDSSSYTVWIILGSVAGALVLAIIGVFFFRRRSKKDVGHDDDVISTYGGHMSSPHGGHMSSPQLEMGYGEMPQTQQSFDQSYIPAVVSPAQNYNAPLVTPSQREEPALSDVSYLRQSLASSDRRHTEGMISPTNNIWLSALTSATNAATARVESGVFQSNLSDSYTLDPSSFSPSSDEPSESFFSKYSSSFDGRSSAESHQI
ncbi:hypothetical protein LEN26_002788 [Aphanomyces euteiches]|nr:hypothetical protein LEN26_002788 [Aphanomyces euteiches]